MGGVWMRTRSEFRSSWRPWLALALLVGLAGGVAIAAVAGARRTATAYPRLVAWSNAADIETGEFPPGVDPGRAMDRIAALASVLAWSRIDTVTGGFVLPSGKRLVNPQLFGVSDLRGQFLTRIGRAKVLDGRMFDPGAKDEAVVDFAVAQAQGIHVGDVLRAYVGDPNAAHPRTVPVRIVGVVAVARVFPAFGANNVVGTVELSPAFAPANGVRPVPLEASLELRLKDGAAGVPAFLAQVRRLGLGGDFPFVQTARTAGVQRSTRLEAGAFWALAAVILLAAGAVLGQAISRQTYLSSPGVPDPAGPGDVAARPVLARPRSGRDRRCRWRCDRRDPCVLALTVDTDRPGPCGRAQPRLRTRRLGVRPGSRRHLRRSPCCSRRSRHGVPPGSHRPPPTS